MRRNNRFKKRFKQKKPIFKTRVFWDFILGFIFILVLAYFLFFSPVFRITVIGVTAPSGFSGDISAIKQIIGEEIGNSFFGFAKKNTYFLVDEKKIKNRILALYPEVNIVIVKKEFLGALNVEIKLRQAAAVWCYTDNNSKTNHTMEGVGLLPPPSQQLDCFLIDEIGIIFKHLPAETGNNGQAEAENGIETENLLFVIREQELAKGMLEQAATKKVIDEMLLIYDAFLNDIEAEVDSFVADGATACQVKTKEGWDAYFELGGDIQLTLTKLKLLFEKEITQEQRKNLSYIDLRFSKVYYK